MTKTERATFTLLSAAVIANAGVVHYAARQAKKRILAIDAALNNTILCVTARG
jgi:hypothetical protein